MSNDEARGEVEFSARIIAGDARSADGPIASFQDTRTENDHDHIVDIEIECAASRRAQEDD
ncbi:MAG: hypothetical protein KDB53_11890 [Planctomycetes bacterium]|nr:hypothetical protein [Planctomycetota bacterium]